MVDRYEQYILLFFFKFVFSCPKIKDINRESHHPTLRHGRRERGIENWKWKIEN